MTYLRALTSQPTLLLSSGLGLVVLLAAQVIYQQAESPLWALVVLLPGLLCVVLGLRLAAAGRLLILFGCVTVTLGAVLGFQAITGLWQTWLYMWLLLIPAVGISKVLYGRAADVVAISDEGWRQFGSGLVIFHIALFFFEIVVGLSGMGLFNSPILYVFGPVAAFVLLGMALMIDEPSA